MPLQGNTAKPIAMTARNVVGLPLLLTLLCFRSSTAILASFFTFSFISLGLLACVFSLLLRLDAVPLSSSSSFIRSSSSPLFSGKGFFFCRVSLYFEQLLFVYYTHIAVISSVTSNLMSHNRCFSSLFRVCHNHNRFYVDHNTHTTTWNAPPMPPPPPPSENMSIVCLYIFGTQHLDHCLSRRPHILHSQFHSSWRYRHRISAW